MTYDKPNETLRFVWRNESFRFRFFGRVRVQNETKRTVALRVMELAGLGDLRARRPSKWAPLAGLVPQGAMRSIASRRAVRSDQYLRCGSGAFPSQGGLSRPPRGASERGLGNSKARKKLRRSALKSLKQLVRVNLCATPRKEAKLMTVGELRTLAALVGELGSTNFTTAISANFGNLADDAEVALDVVAVLFPPSAPFDVAAGVLLELAVYCAPLIHITADPNPIADAQTTLTRAGRG